MPLAAARPEAVAQSVARPTVAREIAGSIPVGFVQARRVAVTGRSIRLSSLRGRNAGLKSPMVPFDSGGRHPELHDEAHAGVVEWQTRDAQNVVPSRHGSSTLPLVTEMLTGKNLLNLTQADQCPAESHKL